MEATMRTNILLLLLLFFAVTLASLAHAAETKTAIFAGGCFWCMQSAFDKTPGIVATRVGFTGGDAASAQYETVSTGSTEHLEAIEVTYDPSKTPYETLLETYWENIDPTDAEGQFADRGSQYHPAIFYADATQQHAAEVSKKAIAAKFAPKPIVVQILPAKPFYVGEEYHQKYYAKHPLEYNAYKHGSGRADYLEKTWGTKN
jgi:peptide-methionine (S)-S-oxide reductase